MSVQIRKWINEAAEGLIPPEVTKQLQARVLAAAANDAGGERVYIPSRVTQKTAQFRSALKLVELGFSMQECEALAGMEISKRTFFRWKRRLEDSGKVMSLILGKHQQARYGAVYALQFEGPGGESWVKIGTTFMPKARFRTHTSRCQLVLTGGAIARFISRGEGQPYGTHYGIETEVHNHFKDCRVETEWFDIEGGYLEAIKVISEIAHRHFDDVRVRVA